eukprot:gnl/TRDRNA2_/TRDRNA2_197083_c0_seq1.p1 gnl/TRDRNA2_/TRDRNA2_197083_c0~~gnl/TRDRNA2_/TRDRNA2_197083_c0_seq1.p1  ORF type:complete len:305 (+),score=59.21 gnl/TRDRNA2_/TRDRNA2_197083_c0_seq1:121-1035(+)
MVALLLGYVAVPTGAVLTAMLLSGLKLPMAAARAVLISPVRVGSQQLSIAVVMTALCGIASVLYYSGFRRCQHLVEQPGSQAMLTYDRDLVSYFHAGRNLWLALCALSLWVAAWRLNSLHACGQLRTADKSLAPRSRAARGLWAVAALLFFVLADVPLSRVNYNLQLAYLVTPRKNTLLASADSRCENAMLEAEGQTGPCATICTQARGIAEERLAVLRFTRQWHFMGSKAAEIFDKVRGVQQGDERIDKLFQDKSCVGVARSVDKSNMLVNYACIFFGVLAVVGFIVSLSNSLADNVEAEKRD